jgi:2-oxoglutarate ferredoxin oxidoreductase subunit beta
MTESLVFSRPDALKEAPWHYCPGCLHGVAHRLVAEALDALGVRERTIGVAPVGCAVFVYNYFNTDFVEAAHGRAPAMAVGIKRVHPDRVVFTYQGDGDLAAIGLAEAMHAAARGERLTTIFVNNAVYGMTGGQMAPTSLTGQVTTSSPCGRDSATTGLPFHMAELMASLPGTVYSVRRSLHDAKSILKAKQAVQRAFEIQLEDRGYTFVELLSTCPTNWGLSPTEAVTWMQENLLPVYPVGDYKVS